MFIYSRIVLLMIWQNWKIFLRPIGLLATFITSSWPFYQNKIVRIRKTKCCDTEHDKTSRQDKNINHIKVLITAGPLMLQNLFSTVKVVQIEINPMYASRMHGECRALPLLVVGSFVALLNRSTEVSVLFDTKNTLPQVNHIS